MSEGLRCPACGAPLLPDSTALDPLADVVSQACTRADGTLDSAALRDYADALRYLAEVGRVEIVHEAGRRVIARWK